MSVRNPVYRVMVERDAYGKPYVCVQRKLGRRYYFRSSKDSLRRLSDALWVKRIDEDWHIAPIAGFSVGWVTWRADVPL